MVRRRNKKGGFYHEPPFTPEEEEELYRRTDGGPVAFARPFSNRCTAPAAAVSSPIHFDQMGVALHFLWRCFLEV